MKKHTLRPYQVKDSNSIFNYFKDYNSILYQLPTGGGKTVVIEDIVSKCINEEASYLGKKIIILVHKRDIVFQIRDVLRSQGKDVGVLIGNYEENIEADILVGSVLTIARDARIDGIFDKNFDFMIIDEAHHARSNSYSKVIEKFKSHSKNYKILGVTATPYRKDKKSLDRVFDLLIIGPSIKELQEQGYLCKAKTYVSNLTELDSEVGTSGGDYNITELSKFMRNPVIINHALESYKLKGENKPMLVFCVNKAHALEVMEAYKEAGYDKINHIDADTDYDLRAQILEDFKNGELQIITSIQTLTEGIDVPNTGVLQYLRPTLSLVLYLQMGGRGLRPKDDGSDLIILDIANCSKEHGLLDTTREWTLKNENPNRKTKLNKVVGKRGDGSITDDFEEIEKEGLELIELSPEEYFTQKSNGIEEAEKNNNEVYDKIWEKYLELIKLTSSLIKTPGLKFVPNGPKEELISYDYRFGKILVRSSRGELASLRLENGEGFIKVEKEYWSRGGGVERNLDSLKDGYMFGKICEFMLKKSVSKQLYKFWIELYNLKEELISIQDIEAKIHDFKKQQLLKKINYRLSKGKYNLKLKKSFWLSGYCRDLWSNADELVFLDKPSSVRSINKIKFFDAGVSRGSVSSFKKEDILSVATDNHNLK